MKNLFTRAEESPKFRNFLVLTLIAFFIGMVLFSISILNEAKIYMKQQAELRKTINVSDTGWSVHLYGDRKLVIVKIAEINKDSVTVTLKVSKDDLQK
jgi:hypothetical protein